MSIKPETAWACFATDGSPYPFIHSGTVRTYRDEAQTILGRAWMRKGETVMQGWRRAYRKGWRCIKVTVSAASGDGTDGDDG